MPRINRSDRSDGNVQAVALALQIIDALGSSGEPARLTDLASKLGTTKGRVHRHLRTLVNLKYVAQERQTEQYLVGARLVQLGSVIANRFNLLEVSRPIMRRLRDRLRHTVVPSRFLADKVFAIEQVDGASLVVFSTTIGAPLGLHNSAQGKVALAFGPTGLLEATIKVGLKARTSATITNPDRLRKQIAEVRKRGWAVAPGETLTGLNGLGAPIFGREGTLIGTLAVLASVDEISARPSKRQIAEVTAAAREISAVAG